MTNIILNITADGTWQSLNAALGFPRHAKYVTVQARDAQVDMYYRYINQTAYFTIKSGTIRTILYGNLDPEELLVRANNGVVMEIEVSTQLTV